MRSLSPMRVPGPQIHWDPARDETVVVERTSGALGAGWSAAAVSVESTPILAHAMGAVSQAIAITDHDLRMVFSNARWDVLLNMPCIPAHAARSMHTLIDYLARRGEYGPGDPDRHATFRKNAIRDGLQFQLLRPSTAAGQLIVAGSPIPGGYVTTLTEFISPDVSETLIETELANRTKALRDENAALLRLAETDALLDIPNRRAFDRVALEQACRRTNPGDVGAVVLIDVDRFKSVNDRYGHLAGDAVLKAVAKVLRDGLGSVDHLFRYGGEEFAAILVGASKHDALLRAEVLRHAVEQAIVEFGPTTLSVTASIGVAIWRDTEPAIDGAMARADDGLYRAKSAGRNRVVPVF